MDTHQNLDDDPARSVIKILVGIDKPLSVRSMSGHSCMEHLQNFAQNVPGIQAFLHGASEF